MKIICRCVNSVDVDEFIESIPDLKTVLKHVRSYTCGSRNFIDENFMKKKNRPPNSFEENSARNRKNAVHDEEVSFASYVLMSQLSLNS